MFLKLKKNKSVKISVYRALTWPINSYQILITDLYVIMLLHLFFDVVCTKPIFPFNNTQTWMFTTHNLKDQTEW
jgi:hypothetical protein